MLDLGPHANFIVAAYAVTVLAIGALTLVTIGDDREQRRKLAELERKGVKRRSAVSSAAAGKRPAKRKTGASRTRKSRA